MMWMPNFNPKAWILSASGLKPFPPAAEGKRFGAGISRPKLSAESGTPERAFESLSCAPGSYQR